MTVGLPTTLEDIGLSHPTEEEIMDAAKVTCAEGESIYNMPMEITPEKVYAAIWAPTPWDASIKEYSPVK